MDHNDTDRIIKGLDDAEWWAMFTAGNITLRHGPFNGPQVGQVVSRSVELGFPMHITANCGRIVDFDMIREMFADVEAMAAEVASEPSK